ncbi:MAG: class I SAM-dependent DNA methyltransferase [Brevundimonas sp.]|nr:MAG: class I SAM-dependent DNA methyltransferase [Brevundimonas sp.]
MRCVFTLFAADVGLLPKDKLIVLLEDCIAAPQTFAPMMTDLWRRFREPDHEQRFFSGFGEHVPHIGGDLFRQPEAFPLEAEEIALLLTAAHRRWDSVEPSIFSELFEQALASAERRKLGAHFTPRAYVARLVELAVMQPLRQAWLDVQLQIEAARHGKDMRKAVRLARDFHHRLCETRVLDPACGTGNFLFVAQELMKGLEGEVLDLLTDLGCSDELDIVTIRPSQFLGIELNPRAAKLADLVLRLGFLQLHYRNHTAHPAEPILLSGSTIVLADALMDWDGAPAAQHAYQASGVVQIWPNARQTPWPDAEFIIGNPPFIGGKDLRSRMDPGYAETLWRIYPQMNESADLVMYWWDRAAQALTRPGTSLQRFGFVTTNSISQVFQRRTIERWMSGVRPLSLVYAVADHPWSPAEPNAAAVRIAMTVAEAGMKDGVLLGCIDGEGSGGALLPLAEPSRIHSDLSVGVDVTTAVALKANAGLCSPGVKLHGAGFIVGAEDLAAMGLGRRDGLERHLRPYRNGRDLTGRSRDSWVLDFYGMTAAAVRERFPEAYQHLVEQVKELRDPQGRPIGRDANARAVYREVWWVFGEPRAQFRPALKGLERYIVTVETAKHRLFQFLDAEVIADNMLVCVADDDAATLAVLSSKVHSAWCTASGGSLEDRPRYTKSRCFDPFPFPQPTHDQRAALRAAGEALDAHRRSVLADNPDITLTALYNVLERIHASAPLGPVDEAIKQRGLVLILRDLHRDIDELTLQAYGWPGAISDAEIVQNLVLSNRRRQAEEAQGDIAWLRPDYQRDRATEPEPVAQLLPLAPPPDTTPRLRIFPKPPYEHPLAVQAALGEATSPQRISDLARRFKGGRRNERRIDQALVILHRYGHVHRLEDGRWLPR